MRHRVVWLTGGIVVDRENGYEGALSEEQFAEIQADDCLAVEGVKSVAPKPPAKEGFAAAEAEGLNLEVTDKNTVAEINAAIEAARASSESEGNSDGQGDGDDEGADQSEHEQ